MFSYEEVLNAAKDAKPMANELVTNEDGNDPVDDGTFPPWAYLGYTVDMLSCSPADIGLLSKSLNTSRKWITLPDTGTIREIEGVTWTLPRGTGVSGDVNSGQSFSSSYESGSTAFQSISGDASLSAKYMAASGDTSLHYSLAKSFQSSYAYSLFSYNQTLLQVRLLEWANLIAEDTLKKLLTIALPNPWDENNASIIAEYRRFFDSYGSHVVTACTYGSRLQIMTWSSNENTEVAKSMAANASVQYNGLTTGGKFDINIKAQEQYKEFAKQYNKTCTAFGGKPDLAMGIGSGPEADNVWDKFQEWLGSTLTDPGIMAMTLIPFSDILHLAFDPDINKRAKDVSNAYKWITEHPEVKRVKCTFDIASDWGEVGILTPSAYIRKDPDNPNWPETTNFQTTKISWGREQSRTFDRVTIAFIIENDGLPIDIVLSHGSDGSTSGNGQCIVTIGRNKFENIGSKDGNWNSQWFPQCSVV